MPRSIPKPAPYLKDNEVRQAIEPLYLAFYTNEEEVAALQEAAVAAAQAAADAADAAAAAAQAVADLAAERVGERGHDEKAGEGTRAAGGFGDLEVGTDVTGPSVTIDVEAGDIVLLVAQVEAKTTGASAEYGVYEATDYASVLSLGAAAGATYSTDTTPVTPLTIATPGSRTYSLKYQPNGGGTSTYKNRKLWVWTASGF